LEKDLIYIQHVEGTAFTTIMIMIMEKNGKFCAGKGQSCGRLWYQHKDIHEHACGSSDDKICNQTDCIMVNSRHCTDICGVRSVWDDEIDARPFLVTAKIVLKSKRNVKTRKSLIKKRDIRELNVKEVKEKFMKKVDSKCTKYSVRSSGRYK
jgi:hypothetical protein